MPRTKTEKNYGFLEHDARSWKLELESSNRSPKTVTTYLDGVAALVRWLEEHGFAGDVEAIDADLLREFLGWVVAEQSDGTAKTRHTGLTQFFKFLVEEGDLDVTPMATVRQPKVSEKLVEVLDIDEDVRALLKTCDDSPRFENRRDIAIIRFLYDVGVRASELVTTQLNDVNLDTKSVVVMGKGSRPRVVPFGTRTAKALDRYLRVRRGHTFADRPEMWLSQKGALGYQGLYAMLRRRCDRAGIAPTHPHQFRHTWADAYMADGGNETDLMIVAGWKDPAMARRYGRANAERRALSNFQRHSPGDKL